MHAEAYAFVAEMVVKHGPFADVVEFGSRDVNGSARGLFPGAAYRGVDLVRGPGVDMVADAAGYRNDDGHDCVVCVEVFEHARSLPKIVAAAWVALCPGGLFIVTAAAPPREPHSGVDGGPLRPGEFYRNVGPVMMAELLEKFDVETFENHTSRGDIYVAARKPGRSDG